jgi:hypothetical protein
VTGNTSTTSGLTVTLSRDQSSDCAIEAGALVLADQVRYRMVPTKTATYGRYGSTVPYGLRLHIFITSCHILACFGELKNYFQRTDCFFSRENIGLMGYVLFFTKLGPEPLFVPYGTL